MKKTNNHSKKQFHPVWKGFTCILLLALMAPVISFAQPVCPADVNQPPNQVVCDNSGTSPVNFTSTFSAVTFNWVNNNPTIGLPANGTGNIPSFTAVNPGPGPVTATITVTPSTIFGRFAYVTNESDNTVSVINTSNNSIVTTIGVGHLPNGVSVSPDGSKVYISNFLSNTVSVISTSSNTVVATVPVDYGPVGLVVSPDGLKVYVANAASLTVSVINTLTNVVDASINTDPGNPYGIVISPDGSRLYVTNNNNNTVSVINTSTNTVVATITTGSNPYGLILSKDGSSLYVANSGSNDITVINTSSNTATGSIVVGFSPRAIVACPNGFQLYVTNSGSDNVSRVNTITGTVDSWITVGSSPLGISVNEDGSMVYVVNRSSNNVSIINTSSNTVSSIVGVGSAPAGFGNFINRGGCDGPPKSFTITVLEKISPFIIYAKSEVEFGRNNKIHGDVGVTKANGIAEFESGDVLNPFRVFAKNIEVESPSQVSNRTYAPATGGPNPAILVYNGTGGSGNYTASGNGTINGNYHNLTIKEGITATITGNDFGEIHIGKSAKVTFTRSLINLNELEIKQGEAANPTMVKFNQATDIKVSRAVEISKNCRINDGGPRVTFHLNDNYPDEEEFIVDGKNTVVTANIYIPHGKLEVDGDENGSTIMTGLFVIEELESGENVIWNKNICVNPLAPVSVMPGSEITNSQVLNPANKANLLITSTLAVPGGLNAIIYPNPTSGEFNLKVLTNATEPISVRILDAMGTNIQSFANVAKSGIMKLSQSNRGGTYFVEVTQGKQRKVLRLVRTN